MLNFLKSAGVLAVAALLLAGCSKSSSTSSGGTAPTLAAPTFTGPSSTSASADTSFGATYANSVAGLFNATSAAYLGFYSGNGTQSGNTWTWTYSQGGFTATWSATASGSSYDWKLVYNGTLEGVNYSNWTALSGTETTDGKTGNWAIYYPPTTVVAYQVTWSTASNGTLTGTIVANDSTGAEQLKYEFTNNSDKSGELKIYTGGTVLTLDVTWTSTGSGQWIEYDDQGVEIGAGSWT